MSIRSSYASGIDSFISCTSRGVRTPDTTSSPCAFGRKSPDGVGSPVISSRLNATPEHELSPLFPNTICCTFTAVPHSSGMWLIRRYSTARLPVQESNTAVIAWRSCSCGSCGNSSPVSVSERFLELSRQVLEVLGIEFDVFSDTRRLLLFLDQVLVSLTRNPAADVAEHLREAAVGIPGEPLITGRPGQTLDGLIVEAEVQNRVEHPRHRLACAASHRHQQWIVRLAE